MKNERTPLSRHEVTVDEIVGEIRSIDGQIKKSFQRNQPDRTALAKKDNFLIAALQLRAGRDSRIKLQMSGEDGDTLHEYSANEITLLIFPSERVDQKPDLITRTSLSALRQAYREDLLLLIGSPDLWKWEDPPTKVRRLFVEVNAIDRDLRDAVQGHSTKRINTLNALKVRNAENIFMLLSEGKLNEGRIIVEEENKNLINVTLTGDGYVRRNFGFKLLRSAHLLPNPGLRKLVDSALANQSQRK